MELDEVGKRVEKAMEERNQQEGEQKYEGWGGEAVKPGGITLTTKGA